ncbi:tyrosine-type recombinase/integrase [Mycobacterium aquaticum]|uniref:Site-specific integrase n=1 Tax=Mycobacterium aquaticum TaxID=1927124 RepID=A0A1X0A575_9MYCO|nr:site-specific integrase [Mycobacterium aquaticum]ORA25210.1 hypothetical protein BST13_33370 [Mycobacterium aquaticum]
MAWVKKDRKRKDGSVYHSVMFRELNHGTGKMQQTSISYGDVDDAEHACALINQLGPDRAREVLKIVQAPRTEQTVAQFLSKHIDHLTGVEPGTLARYRAYVRNDLGTLADIPLTALSRDDIARWVNAMPGSAKTIKNKRDFVSGALKAAVKDGVLPSNPAEGVKNPRWDRREMVFLDKAEFALLLEVVPQYWQPLVRFLVSSGCRWSEATALRPADIDIKAGTVRISKAWKTGAGGYVLGVPKTRKSVRTINVPASILKPLDLTGEWVFTNSGRGKGQFAGGVIAADNGPVRIHSFNPNVWTPAVERAMEAGLTKKPRVHDLRHTCASWLIQAGRPLPAVQAQLGHESIQTTSDVYGHLDRSSGQDNAAVIAGMLS